MAGTEKSNWSGVPWYLPDATIAKRVGVTRERVRQKRVDLGIPDSPLKNMHSKTVEVIESLSERDDLDRVSMRSLASEYGVAPQTIRTALQYLGAYRGRMNAKKPSTYDWGNVDFDRPNNIIARELDVPPEYVSMAKRRYRARTLGEKVVLHTRAIPFRIAITDYLKNAEGFVTAKQVGEALGINNNTARLHMMEMSKGPKVISKPLVQRPYIPTGFKWEGGQ